jgi:hypothetical protein
VAGSAAAAVGRAAAAAAAGAAAAAAGLSSGMGMTPGGSPVLGSCSCALAPRAAAIQSNTVNKGGKRPFRVSVIG